MPFLRVEAGPFVFARLAREARNRSDEILMVQNLSNAGVLVTPGTGLGGWGSWGNEAQVSGWARITFAVPMAQLREGLDKIGRVLGFGDKSTSVGHGNAAGPSEYQPASFERRTMV